MKRLFVLPLLALAAAAHAGPGAHGPNGEHLDAAPAAASADVLARLPDGSVVLPMPAQRRLQIRTQLGELSDAAASVELPARVVMDPNSSGRVQTATGGTVHPGPRGLPVPGQRVRKGEVLARVVFQPSPLERANQRAQLAEVRAELQLARQQAQRLQSLEGTVARREIEAAQAAVQSLAGRERALAGSVGAAEALLAPVDGVIARADVVAGQVVEPRDLLFEVVDPGRLLIEATTSDPAIAAGIVGAALLGHPGVELKLLGAARSLRDGAMPVSFRASGRGALPLALALGQPVQVVARLAGSLKGVVLPADAVVRNAANEPVVWLKTSAERFVPQPVRAQPLDATRVVVQGVEPGVRVVVQGANLIAQIR
ncbi:efflux RND transporter periplasmic adaptor subunit [Rubrivivax gelatinosus]|uniref:CusB/HlyD membrane fusion family barrel-sandwich protein n=1 Tax=Rubrivivax gelatinosus TaxID=28068 RepID=A0A4R2MJ98_RUBGE|nr:HlyD family efflux transporter periplasmic adaptor subunit [Rubrivivax gelatinosus]MBK1687613.1 hypothetical protein [Rubrivivax gelatinosus]TCP02986.1 CusB/HlyD membrane fusion family barrel-sandwich protein [Rubrivivax gelatinosus]